MKKQSLLLYLFLLVVLNGYSQNGTYQVTETSVPSFTDLSTLVNSIGTSPETIHINKSLTLSNNLTIPENISLKFYSRAVINLNGKTLTINGAIDAGPFQIFNGNGTVNGMPKILEALPDWWKNPNDSYWTSAIQKAVNFYSRVFIKSGKYYLDDTVNLSPSTNHIIIGNGRSTNLYLDADKYIFSMISDLTFPTHSSFEGLYFHCKKGIKINNETSPIIINNQILNLKINRCIFSHDQGSGAIANSDIAINLYETFDSTISENLIENFDIGIKLKGCDINSIYDNRIQNFNKYAILDLNEPNNQMTGSQTSISHNDVLSYRGNDNAGAFIKSNNFHVIIRDNFLEQSGSQNKPIAYIDCSNIGLENSETFSYNIDITGNRLSTGTYFSYLINEEFKSLNLSDIPIALPLEDVPPSSFCKNSTSLQLVRNLPISYQDRSRHINISNVFSFREWRTFNSTNVLQNDNNGAMIINPYNITDLGHDPDGHTATFSPKSIKLIKDKYIKVQISQKISGETGELNSLPKNLIIKIITRNISTGAIATNNQDYFVTIKKNGENDVDIWQGYGTYICNNTSDSNFNNFNTFVISPTIQFDSNSDYWMLLVPLNSNKEIKSIILEPDNNCLLVAKDKNEDQINIDVNEELKIYPNPMDNILKIETGNNSIIKSIIIYDLSGKFLKDFTKEVKDNSINVSSLSSGSYIVETVTENNTSKIILKK